MWCHSSERTAGINFMWCFWKQQQQQHHLQKASVNWVRLNVLLYNLSLVTGLFFCLNQYILALICLSVLKCWKILTFYTHTPVMSQDLHDSGVCWRQTETVVRRAVYNATYYLLSHAVYLCSALKWCHGYESNTGFKGHGFSHHSVKLIISLW